ncbi:MAG: hypothetical protein RJA91_122 [Pseudomonadota bacterium]|jgi:hypothetical protein
MTRTEIYVENNLIELFEDVGASFTYTIDDVVDFGAKNTSFSLTISIPQTAINNRIFGYAFEIGMAHDHNMDIANVNTNFTPSQVAKCEIYVDKIQVFKGVIKILEIIVQNGTGTYQCAVFGELNGFVSELGNKRLEDLDFSEHNHTWNVTNIQNSWNSITGNGYYYPLIDYGDVSTGKDDFHVSTFRPALYVKEYIEKIFEGTSYTYNSDFIDSAFFEKLIIPNNSQGIQGTNDRFILATIAANKTILNSNTPTARAVDLAFDSTTLLNFTENVGKSQFTYTDGTKTIRATATITGTYQTDSANSIIAKLFINGTAVQTLTQNTFSANNPFTFNIDYTGDIALNNVVKIEISVPNTANTYVVTITNATFTFQQLSAQLTSVAYNGTVSMNANLPKGIFQKDFFFSICKMFNLYVYQDTLNENQINIKPYIDFYSDSSVGALDWSQKIDMNNPMSIKPMSQLNARYYAYRYAQDTDYYNENYFKKYGQGYGDNIYDSEFDFVKDTATTQIIFAASVLVLHSGQDKYHTSIYKLSNSNTNEDPMDSVIRILMAKKITDVSQWKIQQDGGGTLATITSYGYAGHLDNPSNPTIDINFGAPKELQFPASTYPTNNLFNTYHKPYILEITDMESKLLTCRVYLSTLDIYNLDFSKYIWINGVLFRLNKISNYNPLNYSTTEVNLLKVINTQ